MTDDRMAMMERIEKGADDDRVGEMQAFAAERIMELGGARRATFAGHGSRSPTRTNHRNGYRV